MRERSNRNPATTAKVTVALYALALFAVWHLAVSLSTPGMAVTDVEDTLRALIRLQPLDALPGGGPPSPGVTLAIAAAGVLVLVAIPVLWAWRPRRRDRPARKATAQGLGTARQVTKHLASGHGPGGAQIEPIATINGRPIRPRQEDTGAIIAPPRAGKTAYFAAGKVIDADGSVVATSTRLDLVRLTAEIRSKLGPVLVFDPDEVGVWREPAHWDIVAGCEDADEAVCRADAMVAGRPLGSSGNAQFFADSGAIVLRCLLHAAAIERLTMRDVTRWARNFDDPEPVQILDSSPRAEPHWADDLRRFTREKSETTSSLSLTLSTTLKPLGTSRVLNLVCPKPGAPMIDTAEIAAGKQAFTVYLLSSGGKGASSGVITALAASIDRQARRESQRYRSGILPRTLTWVLDEVANVAPLPDLPQMMSDSGARGMPVWTISQSFSQLEQRWDGFGARTIWNSAGVKLVLGGSADEEFLERTSRLLGTVKVAESSIQHSSEGAVSGSSTSAHEERVLEASQIRELAPGKALMLYGPLKASIVDLVRWWDRRDAAAIRSSIEWTWNTLEDHPTASMPASVITDLGTTGELPNGG